jgi:hypothetical protein
MKRFIGVTALLLLLSFNSIAVLRAVPFLDRLQGEWTGQGTAFGLAAQVQTKWESVLDGKFVRLSLSYTTKTNSGVEQTFAGHGYYQAKGEGAYEGYWFDTQGNQYPIKAKLEGNSLTALWGIPGKIEGKSVYSLTDSDKSFGVNDSLKQKDGSWRDFSRFELKRK